MSQAHPTYRPDIDGLRALAIAGVLIYHVNPLWLPGGFVGVDVFFVISGFLITSIIGRDMEAGRFSLANFYERRIRRIVPALFFMLLCASIAGYRMLMPDDFASFAKSLVHSVASISNIFFYQAKRDYFTDAVNDVPLIHTWSLGVEEQFYLFFPLLLMVFRRYVKSRRMLLCWFIGLSLLSLGLAAWYVAHKPDKAFFLLPFRAWEMLAGAILALIVSIPSVRVGNAAGILGLTLVAGTMALFSDKTPFPGFAALGPCLGAALLIYAGKNPHSWTRKILSFKPLVALGLISYSVYLWHWPVIAFAKYNVFYQSSMAVYLLLSSIVLGALSWRFIERPFRNPGFLSRRKVFISWAVASAALVIMGLVVSGSHGFPSRFSPEVTKLQAYQERPNIPGGPRRDHSSLRNSPKLGDVSVPPSIVVWGDSHAESLLPLMDVLGKNEKKCIQNLSKLSTPPVLALERKVAGSDRGPDDYAERVMAYLLAEPSIKSVILSARWSLYSRGRTESPEDDSRAFEEGTFTTQQQVEQYYAAQLKLTVDKLLAGGKKVVIVYPWPEIGFNVPDYLSKISAAGEQVPSFVPCRDYDERNQSIIAALDALGQQENLVRIKPEDILLLKENARIMADKQPLYWDDNHLSQPGVLFLRRLFEPAFLSL